MQLTSRERSILERNRKVDRQIFCVCVVGFLVCIAAILITSFTAKPCDTTTDECDARNLQMLIWWLGASFCAIPTFGYCCLYDPVKRAKRTAAREEMHREFLARCQEDDRKAQAKRDAVNEMEFENRTIEADALRKEAEDKAEATRLIIKYGRQLEALEGAAAAKAKAITTDEEAASRTGSSSSS